MLASLELLKAESTLSFIFSESATICTSICSVSEELVNEFPPLFINKEPAASVFPNISPLNFIGFASTKLI